MNDKKQLAAMGAEMEEKQQQPMCMAKRIEELEAQVRGTADLLREAKPYMDHRGGGAGIKRYSKLLREIDAALAGKMPTPVVPEGWSLVPDMPTPEMCAAFHKADADWEDGWAFDDNGNRHESPVYQWIAMLNAAPSPDGTK